MVGVLFARICLPLCPLSCLWQEPWAEHCPFPYASYVAGPLLAGGLAALVPDPAPGSSWHCTLHPASAFIADNTLGAEGRLGTCRQVAGGSLPWTSARAVRKPRGPGQEPATSIVGSAPESPRHHPEKPGSALARSGVLCSTGATLLGVGYRGGCPKPPSTHSLGFGSRCQWDGERT